MRQQVEDDEGRGTSVLRCGFKRREDGRWGISSIEKLRLEPDDGEPDELYRAKDDIHINHPTTLGTRHWAIGQSIVPVVMLEPRESPRTIRCLGTGFFISCSGLLLTAGHVVIDPIERLGQQAVERDSFWHIPNNGRLGIMLPTNPILQLDGYLFREIEWAGFLGQPADNPLPFAGLDMRLNADAAICKVQAMPDQSPYQPLSIIQPGIRGVGLGVGKSATAVGYGSMDRLIELNSGGDLHFAPFVSRGSILEHFPDNAATKSVPTPGPCFAASMKFPGGMSGSPIFDDERMYVHGVVSKGWQDETGLAQLGYGSMVAPLLSLPIPFLDGKSLLDVLKSGEHGMPKMQIAGA